MTGAQLRPMRWAKTRVVATIQLIALLSFQHIVSADTNPPRPEPANWRSCKSDSECVLVKGVCGGIAPININFESDFKDWLNRISLVVFCNSLVAYSPWPTGIYASCRLGQCFGIVPRSTPSPKNTKAKKKSVSYHYQSLQDGNSVSPVMPNSLTEKNVNEISEINPTVEPLKSFGFDRPILYETPKVVPASSGLDILNQKFKQARAVPYFENGKLVGYTLFQIAKDSAYEKMGLKDGDIVQSWNGARISSSPGTFTTISKLDGTDKIDIIRNGRKMKLPAPPATSTESPSPRTRGATIDEQRIKEPNYPVYTDEHGYLHMDSRDSRYGDTPQGMQRVMPWYILPTPVSSSVPGGTH